MGQSCFHQTGQTLGEPGGIGAQIPSNGQLASRDLWEIHRADRLGSYLNSCSASLGLLSTVWPLEAPSRNVVRESNHPIRTSLPPITARIAERTFDVGISVLGVTCVLDEKENCSAEAQMYSFECH